MVRLAFCLAINAHKSLSLVNKIIDIFYYLIVRLVLAKRINKGTSLYEKISSSELGSFVH